VSKKGAESVVFFGLEGTLHSNNNFIVIYTYYWLNNCKS